MPFHLVQTSGADLNTLALYVAQQRTVHASQPPTPQKPLDQHTGSLTAACEIDGDVPTESLKYGTMKHFVKLEKGITGKFPPIGLKWELMTGNQPRVMKWASEWMLEFDLEPQLESEDEESPCMEDLES